MSEPTKAIAIVAAVVAMFYALKFSVDLSCSLEKGCIFHHGWKLFNPKIELLCGDMIANPKSYAIGRYELTSKLVCIWIANGWAFYADYNARHEVGKFSMWDRWRFERALRVVRASQFRPQVFTQDDVARFQHALRQQERP